MVLPMGLRALAITESVSLYGGLAVFGGFVLYEYVVILLNRIRFNLLLQHTKNSPARSDGSTGFDEGRSNQRVDQLGTRYDQYFVCLSISSIFPTLLTMHLQYPFRSNSLHAK